MNDRTVGRAVAGARIIATTRDATVLDAAKAMAAAGCGSALVVNGDGKLEGIVTERDVMVRAVAKDLPPGKTKIEAIMTPKPYCAKPDMPVTHALLVMKDQGFRHIPVLDGNGAPLGVFSLRDALPSEVTGADELLDACESLAERIA